MPEANTLYISIYIIDFLGGVRGGKCPPFGSTPAYSQVCWNRLFDNWVFDNRVLNNLVLSNRAFSYRVF